MKGETFFEVEQQKNVQRREESKACSGASRSLTRGPFMKKGFFIRQFVFRLVSALQKRWQVIRVRVASKERTSKKVGTAVLLMVTKGNYSW